MNIEEYRARRQELASAEPRHRRLCRTCLQPDFGCYCAQVRRFDPGMKFAILIHPIEFHRRIATGRLSHLCLENSELIMGHDFSADVRVNALLADRRWFPVLLYPGGASRNLTPMTGVERAALLPRDRRPLVFVVDGTWATARKMVRLSANLNRLPRVCFTPPRLSNFRVRRQPKPFCYSTVEAIHHTIELLGPACGLDLSGGEHDHLLRVFDHMVERTLARREGRKTSPFV
jgi:DTW domain-containing protein YfiP